MKATASNFASCELFCLISFSMTVPVQVALDHEETVCLKTVMFD